MKSKIIKVDDHGTHHEALAFWCPGCDRDGHGGMHMLPVNVTLLNRPSWQWDGNLEAPTLSPSILSRGSYVDGERICHSFLRAGVFEFLGDSTHQYANQHVPLPDLPDWFHTERQDIGEWPSENSPEDDEDPECQP